MSNGDFHYDYDFGRMANCQAEAAQAYADCIARGGSEENCRAEERATFRTCMQGLIGCGRKWEWTYQYCKELGGSEEECQAQAYDVFAACLKLGDVARRLKAHARQETLEKMLADDRATARLWNQVFAKKDTAMIFAKKIAEAFKEAGIELEKGETFGCILTAAKVPKYVSQLVPDAPSSGPRLFQVLAPSLMEAVMDVVERDRIKKP
jgi:hypothetical protein